METTRTTEFVEENLKTIFAYALSRVSNKEDAEDYGSAAGQSNKSSLSHENHLSDGTDFTEDLLLKEDCARLRREIALLSREDRECTIAYYFHELSCAEISKQTGISLEMVKYYLYKTRKILKESISMEREFGEKSFNPAPWIFAHFPISRGLPRFMSAKTLPKEILDYSLSRL